MKRILSLYLLFISIATGIVGCSDENGLEKFHGVDVTPNNGNNAAALNFDTSTYLIDYFAIDVLNTFYVWSDEPGMKEKFESVLNPDTCMNPKAAIKDALYKEDRWTRLFDNMTSEVESLHGVETSLGLDVTPYSLSNSDNVILVVNLVYKDGPASKEKIKRGHIFTKMNGRKITINNYRKFFEISTTVTLEFGQLLRDHNSNNFTIQDSGVEVTLTPVKMFEDPIVTTNVFDIDGKKVGYLLYNSFSDDIEDLQKVCSDFKAEGITELILDMRYNGGGMVSTLNAFASMLAPEEVVSTEDIFQTSIFNKALTPVLKDESIERFEKDQLPYNLNLKKIYAIVSRYSASASESLIVGLDPYMDIDIIGEQTHGKFCTGIYLKPETVYESEYYKKYKKYYGDWGIYLMYATFADKNGYNGSRPDGFIPDIEVSDDQFDGYDLGNKNETMLRVALERAGMQFDEPKKAETRAADHLLLKSMPNNHRTYLINDKIQLNGLMIKK